MRHDRPEDREEEVAGKKAPATIIPATIIPATDWRTTDKDEILRRIRARDEKHSVSNLHPEHPIFSTFEVRSPSGMTWSSRFVPEGRWFSQINFGWSSEPRLSMPSCTGRPRMRWVAIHFHGCAALSSVRD